VYEDAAIALAMVKKWRKRFHKVLIDLFDDSRSERPLTHDFPEAVRPIRVERPFASAIRDLGTRGSHSNLLPLGSGIDEHLLPQPKHMPPILLLVI
jgi:hypothetical protein